MKKNLLESVNIDRCVCGKSHSVDADYIFVEHGALKHLADIVRRDAPESCTTMLCDANTYRVAGKQVEEFFSLPHHSLTTCMIAGEEPFVPDEKALGKAVMAMAKGTDRFIAVGSGAINDVTRFLSHKMSIPFMSVATAPSMDGYASSVSSLLVEGVKTTLNACLPRVIIADLDVISEAPDDMKSAGLGDLIGKYIARVDWRLAHIINDEYICEYAIDLVHNALSRCVEAIGDDYPYTDDMLLGLTEGLIISGLAIAMVGKSRPASGAEHHVAHFLEMKALAGEVPSHFHGVKVALGTYLMSIMYHDVFGISYEELERLIEDVRPTAETPTQRAQRLSKAYGMLAPTMLSNWQANRPNGDRLASLKALLRNRWGELQSMVKSQLPATEQLAKTMAKARLPFTPSELGYDTEVITDALICCKEISYKYTLLYLLDELGLLEYFVGRVVDRVTAGRK